MKIRTIAARRTGKRHHVTRTGIHLGSLYAVTSVFTQIRKTWTRIIWIQDKILTFCIKMFNFHRLCASLWLIFAATLPYAIIWQIYEYIGTQYSPSVCNFNIKTITCILVLMDQCSTCTHNQILYTGTHTWNLGIHTSTWALCTCSKPKILQIFL